MAKKKPQPRVYSYLRFSTSEQAMGDSERRQLDLAKAFSDEKKLPLDESLRDEGLSGYHGAHRKKGAFGKFLKRIEAGEIPRGSILVVENIDRLGREDVVTAIETVTTIVKRDISIVTLSPYRAEYTRESINNGMIYQLVGDIKRANAESETKSRRIREVRDQARKAARSTGRILTSQCPEWLRIVDGKFEPIPEAVLCIRRIFELKREGMGAESIAATLNAEGLWERPNGWRSSYVKKIVTNRAVLGEYQPHIKRDGRRTPEGEPIPDYYPQVIDSDVFFDVQRATTGKHVIRGRKDRCGNLLTGIVKCAYCGGTMVFVDKGKPPKGNQYLRCDNGYRGVCCERFSIRYDECERLILDNCDKLKPDDVLPNPNAQAKQTKAMQSRVDGKSGELADIEQQIDNLVDQIGSTKSKTIRDRYELRIAELEIKQAEVQQQLRDAEHELRDAQHDATSLRNWTRGLRELNEAIAKDNAADVRLRLRAHLREFIAKVEVFATGYPALQDSDTKQSSRKQRTAPMVDDFVQEMEGRASDYFPEALDDPKFLRFIHYVAEQRLTKRGRFLRVHFISGASVDLVPEGSLASGMELVQDGRRRAGWRFVSPKLDRLWQDFKA